MLWGMIHDMGEAAPTESQILDLGGGTFDSLPDTEQRAMTALAAEFSNRVESGGVTAETVLAAQYEMGKCRQLFTLFEKLRDCHSKHPFIAQVAELSDADGSLSFRDATGAVLTMMQKYHEERDKFSFRFKRMRGLMPTRRKQMKIATNLQRCSKMSQHFPHQPRRVLR